MSEHEDRIRKKFIDYDARRKPRSVRFCVKCQKDLDPKPVRRVYVTADMVAVHPDDFRQYVPTAGDFGWLLIGNDWKSKGLECLINAVSHLADSNVTILVVGKSS